MRVLTHQENKEFQKTYDFIKIYIGCSHAYCDSVHELRFDSYRVSHELVKFLGNFRNLKEVSYYFNDISKDHVKKTMKKLIDYCFNNKIQPSKLRVSEFKSYTVEREVIEYQEYQYKE